MPIIQIVSPYQPWFMIIGCDEIVAERDANLFLEMYIHNTLFVPVGKYHSMNRR